MTRVLSYQAVLATPLGRIGLRMAGEALSALDYLPATTPEQPPADAATAAVVAQLAAYFRDPQHRFSVPLALSG
ncbi:MAG TPA: cysteine methyltransferase, partial [Candidatus Competibacteraceae bacterium]|nr:cysteine methyltransferase [Candidatus Competibacteraceae bacterium]